MSRAGARQQASSDKPLRILAVVEEATSTRRCLTAAALAGAINARTSLTALHIEVDPGHITTAPEEISLQRLRVPSEGTAADRATRVHRMFEFWSAGRPSLNATWRSRMGTVETVLTKESTDSDLIVVARPHNMDSFDALHGALFETHKLVLFVPDINNLESVHRRILVAWKDHAQAMRAVEGALPWLLAAEQLCVVSVDEVDGTGRFDELQKYFAANQIKAEFRVLQKKPDEHPSQAILQFAQTMGADSIVMGAFRFGMIAEWFFGGVTREILHNSRLPVFLKH